MKTMYPKGAIQKVIEIHCRVMYENLLDNTNLDDFIRDHYRELADTFVSLAMVNDLDDEEEIRAYSDTFEKTITPLALGIFDAIMADLNFVREDQDMLVADVVKSEYSNA
jgi:hypothetical protein